MLINPRTIHSIGNKKRWIYHEKYILYNTIVSHTTRVTRENPSSYKNRRDKTSSARGHSIQPTRLAKPRN